jgi:23S rRNA (cytosine1962-C5)-methyltransferase
VSDLLSPFVASSRPLHVRVRPAAVRAIKRGHPWVFSDAITHSATEGEAGDLVVVHDDKRKQVGLGWYDPDGPIRIRVLHRGGPLALDAAFLQGRALDALALRRPLEARGTDGYRVIHGENDGLGGLVVDRYDRTLVVKLYSRAWLPRVRPLLDALQDALAPERIVLRLSRTTKKALDSLGHDGNALDGALLVGDAPEERVPFHEHGLRFVADPLRGQKTGFFLDQRDNRRRVGALSEGRRVLNVFSYSGGFSLYAARGGASEVTSLDLSAPALEDAERHFALNDEDERIAACRHRTICGDAFAKLAELRDRERARFDLVVIDPPSFAKRQDEIERALESYGRLTRLGLDVLEDGGHIVLASCSSRISARVYQDTVEGAARSAGRPLSVDDVTGHGLDHPVGFPEAAYLKCVFARA